MKKTKRLDSNRHAIVKTRVQEVLKLLIAGVQPPDIIAYTQKKNWGVSVDSIRYYIRIARKYIIEHTEKNIDYYINRGVKRYDDLYFKLYQSQDYKGAASVQEKLEKLLQLGSNQKVAPQVNIANIENFDNELLSKLTYISDE